MARTHRSSTIVALIVCVVGAQWSGPLFASEGEPPAAEMPAAQLVSVTVLDPHDMTFTTSAAGVSPGQPAGTIEPSSFRSSLMSRVRFTPDDASLAVTTPVALSGIHPWDSRLDFVPAAPAAFAQRGWGRGPSRGGRNGAAEAAIILGAIASIAGAAILVYANRPDCSANQMADGCGYGTKVVGGAVLSAGLVGLVVGAVTWR